MPASRLLPTLPSCWLLRDGAPPPQLPQVCVFGGLEKAFFFFINNCHILHQLLTPPLLSLSRQPGMVFIFQAGLCRGDLLKGARPPCSQHANSDAGETMAAAPQTELCSSNHTGATENCPQSNINTPENEKLFPPPK